MGNMRAVVVKAPKDFGVERVEVPLCPARGMLVKVHSCGLCGSDLRTLRRGHHRVQLPWIIGHEVSGTVEEVGRGYPGPYKRGDMLSVAPPVFCGTCEFCRAARPELCEGYLEIGQRWPGGFADYLAVPNEACARGSIFSIPPGLDPAVATIAEPLSSTIHAQEKGNIGLGDTVVVIGAGPVGCMHVALARARGRTGSSWLTSARHVWTWRRFLSRTPSSIPQRPI